MATLNQKIKAEILPNNFTERPDELLPREQMERVADPSLVPDEALVAILLKTGARGLNVLELSRRLIEAFGSMKALVSGDWRTLERRIADWNKANPDRMIKGIGHVKCLELAAAFEMGRRWSRMMPAELRSFKVTDPDAAFKVFQTVFTPGDEKEDLYALLLNAKNCPICEPIRIARGSHDFASAFARDVFKEALKWGAHAVMIAHNHPSGDPTASSADLALTEKLVELGKLSEIKFLDHLILGSPDSAGGRGFISIRETSNIEFKRCLPKMKRKNLGMS